MRATGSLMFEYVAECLIELTRLCRLMDPKEGKWTGKPLAYRESNNFYLRVTRNP